MNSKPPTKHIDYKKNESAISQFNNWTDQHLKRLGNRIKSTKILYHYTGFLGFVGIIQSQKIWLTNHLHLNDPSEIKYGLDFIQPAFDEAKSKLNEANAKTFEVFRELTNLSNFTENVSIYIASFSRNPDDLSQWRAYGDNGKGVALGISTAFFNKQANKHPSDQAPNLIILPVTYGHAACKQRYTSLFTKFSEIIQIGRKEFKNENKSELEQKDFIRQVHKLLQINLLITVLGTKHEAYKSEKEVRLILVHKHDSFNDRLLFRTTGNDIIPYVEEDFPVCEQKGIKNIILGPSTANNAKHGAEALLRRYDAIKNIKIESSKIPYNGG